MNPTRLHAIMSGEARDLRARLARVAMSCAEPFYRAAVGVRNAMFDVGIRKPKKLPRPVISIGNITTGGTGKTPMVIEIVRRLVAMGHKPAVLLRGYAAFETRGDIHVNIDFVPGYEPPPAPPPPPVTGPDKNYSSDETKVLRSALGDTAAVEANPSRVLAADRVLQYRPQTTAFVLDDSFQHRQVARDIDLVLIDVTQPFGFNHVLPRGMLRESLRGLRRADGVILTRVDQTLRSADLPQRIEEITGKPPIARASHTWSGFLRADPPDMRALSDEVSSAASTDARQPIDSLKSQRVVAFCGIGNPAAFETALRSHVNEVAAMHVYPDHYDFSDFRDLTRRLRDAVAKGAQAIVMTEKDWVKWPVMLHAAANVMIPIYRPVLEMKFTEGGDAIDALLRTRLALGP